MELKPGIGLIARDAYINLTGGAPIGAITSLDADMGLGVAFNSMGWGNGPEGWLDFDPDGSYSREQVLTGLALLMAIDGVKP